MKVRCLREPLLDAFQTAAMVAPARSPKAIIQNVKFRATKEEALLLATDLEIAVRCKVSDVEVKKAGECLLPTARVGQILRTLTDEAVDFSLHDNFVEVRAGGSQFELPQNSDPFPDVPAFPAEKKFHVVPARLLQEMIRRTVLATDVENTRYALGGVLVELTENRMTLVGTDGRRLALMEGDAQSSGGHKTEAAPHVVPTKAMKLIERTLQGDATEVSLHLRPNEVLVRTESATISSRLVEGRFPRYQDVIPKKTKHKIECIAEPLLRAVRQAAVVTTEESRGVEFRFESGQLVLSAKSNDAGRSQVTFPISYDAEPIRIIFDPRFVADFLGVISPETAVTVELIDGDSAALWRTPDGYQYVIMPLTPDS